MANTLRGLVVDIIPLPYFGGIRGEWLIGKIIASLLGGRRLISHSLLDLRIFSYFIHLILIKIFPVILVNINYVWWGFVIGYLSHLIRDSLTKQEVPWLFPVPIRFGFPPTRKLRITTGEIIGKAFIYPWLLILNGYLIYVHYVKFVELLNN